METITIRELLTREVDIDIMDDYTEELYIAFCGPAELTDEGQKQFEDLMDLEVDLYDGEAIVRINDLEEFEADRMLDYLITLFHGLAGYISNTLYEKWFI